jgi:peptidoglycan/LPS O-acetylase OafA/YrhL
MMMLGVALHAAVAYMQTPLGELWGYQDAQSLGGLDVFVAFVHTFRMPVFFALAGFFAALLYRRRGVRRMLRNRAQRVLGPLVIGWFVLFPLTVGGFAFAQSGGTADAVPAAVRYVTSLEVLAQLQLLHLWFLSDLLIYYAVALVICGLVGLLLPVTRRRLSAGISWLLQRWYAPIVLAVPTVLTLAPMQSGLLETPGTFNRPIATLAAHGVFFGFGWLLYHQRALLPTLAVRGWGWTLGGCVLFPVHALAVVRLGEQPSGVAHVVAIASLAVMAWLFVFGLTGLCLRYFAQPSPLRRYLADASYWFYLVHLPLVAWGSGLLGTQSWGAGIKYLTLLSGVVAVCWVTYDFAVRSTPIGVFLNGRRYPRGLPLPPYVPSHNPDTPAVPSPEFAHRPEVRPATPAADGRSTNV